MHLVQTRGKTSHREGEVLQYRAEVPECVGKSAQTSRAWSLLNPKSDAQEQKPIDHLVPPHPSFSLDETKNAWGGELQHRRRRLPQRKNINDTKRSFLQASEECCAWSFGLSDKISVLAQG